MSSQTELNSASEEDVSDLDIDGRIVLPATPPYRYVPRPVGDAHRKVYDFDGDAEAPDFMDFHDPLDDLDW